MPVLDCTVVSCAYNSEKKCSKGDIEVGGSQAKVTSETCCSSFRQRGAGASNSMGAPKERASVKCEAEKCVYNEACKCCADKVGIIGANACDCHETECATFKAR